jgi:cell division protein ZapD
MFAANNSLVKYEHPLNEKIRIFLRIEYIWQQLENCLQLDNSANCILSLQNLLQLLEINERQDIKSDAMKYTDKLIVKFHKIKNQSNVDSEKVDEIIDDLAATLAKIKSSVGKLSSGLSSNEWLSMMRQKLIVPGALSPSDLPFLHYWQNFPLNQKKQQLLTWQKSLQPLVEVVNKILFFTRKTSNIYEVTSINGNYQKIIDKQFEPQLITVEIPSQVNTYPEISGNRSRIVIRFLQTDLINKSVLFDNKFDFKLGVCW